MGRGKHAADRSRLAALARRSVVQLPVLSERAARMSRRWLCRLKKEMAEPERGKDSVLRLVVDSRCGRALDDFGTVLVDG